MIKTIAARGKADRELSTTVVLIMSLEPGTPFSKIPVTFPVRKAAFFIFCRVCFQDQSNNDLKNDTMKLSVNETKLTSL